MATIRKRGNTYQIRVSAGYDSLYRQVVHTMTWKPKPGMTEKQIENEVNRQAVMFEEQCTRGIVPTNMKFQELAEKWFEENRSYLMSTGQDIKPETLGIREKIYKTVKELK